MHHKNMRQDLINPDELKSQLQQHGISELKGVKRACLEVNGELSVIKYGAENPDNNPKARTKAV